MPLGEERKSCDTGPSRCSARAGRAAQRHTGHDRRGEAADGAAAVEFVERLSPDVILMDIRMPGMTGIAALERIKASGSASRVLMLTTFALDEYVYGGVAGGRGASGFVLKETEPARLLPAIIAAASREMLFSPTGDAPAGRGVPARRCRRAGLPGRVHRPRTRGTQVGRHRHQQRRHRVPAHRHRRHGEDAPEPGDDETAADQPGSGRGDGLRDRAGHAATVGLAAPEQLVVEPDDRVVLAVGGVERPAGARRSRLRARHAQDPGDDARPADTGATRDAPTIISQMVVLLKDTALGFSITYGELLTWLPPDLSEAKSGAPAGLEHHLFSKQNASCSICSCRWKHRSRSRLHGRRRHGCALTMWTRIHRRHRSPRRS